MFLLDLECIQIRLKLELNYIFPPPRKQLPEVVEQRQRGRKCNTGGGAADGNTRLQAPQDCT